MVHAVILASDSGEHLRPLCSEGESAAFLALGDRRSLLARSVERLAGIIPTAAIWAVVRLLDRSRAEGELDLPRGRVAVVSEDEGLVRALEKVLIQIGSEASTVVLQPATLVVEDEPGYRGCLEAGLAATSAKGVGHALVGSGGESTGVQIWPIRAVSTALNSIAERDGGKTERDLLASIGGSLIPMTLGDVGWLDAADWASVRRLLDYVEKPWGHERLWALNRRYAAKVLFIRAGESLSLQYHEAKDETIRITSGRMRLRYGSSSEALEEAILEPGMSFAIPPRLVHRMEALEDCTVIEVSTPQLTDVVRLEDRYGRI